MLRERQKDTMKVFLRTPRTILSLEAVLKRERGERDLSAQRRSVPIGVIDDQGFAALQNLRGHGYRITELGDIHDVATVSDYGIILSDLQGVGTTLNPAGQGAHLIREIKKRYPDKYIIAYTGAMKSAIIAQSAREYADGFLKKDASIEEWISTLDEAINYVTDPIAVWKRFRSRLLEWDVPLIVIAELEDDFVSYYKFGPERTGSRITQRIGRVSSRLRIFCNF